MTGLSEVLFAGLLMQRHDRQGRKGSLSPPSASTTTTCVQRASAPASADPT